MRGLIGLFGLLVVFSASAIEVNFGDPIEVELKISTVTMNEQGMNVTYEGEAGKYGMVFASHTYVPSNLEETKVTLRAAFKPSMIRASSTGPLQLACEAEMAPH